MIEIREEKPEDIPAIRTVNERAFEQPAEANVVDKLREVCPGILSLVAVQGGKVVGHILFSPAVIEGDGVSIKGMGLAPVAVLPEFQNSGIGSELSREGLRILREQGFPFVIVLGHPDYYPRLGFERASHYGISSQWEGIPDEAFMILILDRKAMGGVSGVARYRDEFDEAM
ncbi:MAG: N-acetyltransferase [Syntrophaceae bacterium]|nr:N-acetyltransferase [Syntrophaceae bacterium]